MAEPVATEEQLLVLNSLMYLQPHGPQTNGTTSVAQWASNLASNEAELNKIIAQAPAKMTESEIRGLLTTIASDPAYNAMIIKDVVATPASPNSKGVEGDPNSVMALIDIGGKPVFVFKGTAGHNDWRDNGMGGYADVTDTPEQQRALAYFNKMMQDYPPGTTALVTGHSKGGNKAQYVALLAGDRVDAAYSFDGQGFNDAFQLKYADLIAKYSWKICTIANQRDFVNILFDAVPGSSSAYTNSPWWNSWNPVDSILRWHTPTTMFDLVNGRFTLDLGGSSSTPSAEMAQIDDFVAFAQDFMTKEDFEYLCYEVMSRFMDGNGGAYGTPIAMPDGFLERLAGLIHNYAETKGMDPREIVRSSGGLGALVGGLLGANGMVDGAAAGAAVGALIAAAPSPGFTRVPRDFRPATRERLLGIIAEVEQEPWWDITTWDVWYRIDQTLFGGVDFAEDEAERATYYRKMIDMQGVTREEIERIFIQVNDEDASLASTAASLTEMSNEIMEKLRTMTERIEA